MCVEIQSAVRSSEASSRCVARREYVQCNTKEPLIGEEMTVEKWSGAYGAVCVCVCCYLRSGRAAPYRKAKEGGGWLTCPHFRGKWGY